MHVWVFVGVHVYVCIHVFVFVCTCVYVCAHVFVDVYMCTCVYMNVCVFVVLTKHSIAEHALGWLASVMCMHGNAMPHACYLHTCTCTCVVICTHINPFDADLKVQKIQKTI